MGSLVNAGFGYIESRQIKKAKDAEAEQLRRAAIAREAQGTNQAYEQRKLGERVQSNAIAAMAASGGVVDSEIIADLKSTTDYNVLSELFASKTESQSIKTQAALKEFEGRQAKRMGTAKLFTTLAVEGVKAAAGGMGGAGSSGGLTSPGTGLDINNGAQFAGYA